MTGTGKCIRKFRQELGYSQEYMAMQLYISQSNYAKIENELINISTQRLKAIADILEVSMHDLLVEHTKKTITLLDTEDDLDQKVIEGLYITTRALYEKIIDDKDKEIAFLREEIKNLRAN
ncbi:helix-turn-helix domain-containing protein [Mesonia maritima]|uniref:Transcriptional regulator with XRE-family HTH domain n=1 Tax=Mesonia maritima TaxID=1793873 RepID=A0ABU1K6Q6_9FLAO|nr:helix-turn-helix transcriptional regulator [Mesonia maritima]MDR6301295.1 transcriptional regulator with XRE-family HTH domain [Mesonia maritima]